MPFLKGLRQKFFFAFAGISVFFGVALLLFVKFDYSQQLRSELEKRGISIARHLAVQSIAPILGRDPLTLKLFALQAQKIEDDILYIFFLDPRSGAVLAHTFGAEFPVELLGAHVLPLGREHSIAHLDTEAGLIYDVAVPVGLGGLGQVHVGLSAQPVAAAVDLLTRDILLVTLLLAGAGLVFSLPLSAALVRPLRDLTQAAREVAAGRFDQQLAEQGKDEIGELARSFNDMTRELQTARQILLERNQALVAEVERRQAAEGELAAQLNFLTTLMNELPEPVFYKNTQGLYLGCNRAFEEFFGLTREAIIGHGLHDLYPETEARIHDQVDRELFDNPGSRQYELQVTAANCKERQVLCKKTTFNDRSGDLAGLIGVLIDVTAERQIDQLRRDFVSTTAHEFQTPLTAILGFCELLQMPDYQASDKREEFVAIIQERAGFLSRLVDQFLDLSRIEDGRALTLHLEPCRPEPLIRKLVGNQRSGHQRFDIRFPQDCPAVLADEDRLAQIMDNLISNAVKYSPPQGRITISAAVEEHLLRISVQDQGVGLAQDNLERIFDKFFRADTRETAPAGSGLGLYIVRALVEALGGQISASSQPGQGATLSFTLPLALPAARDQGAGQGC
ncbi:sensor histidine kinase [Geoalkalibacter sp.]|uniref:sensor histidine kinase n=1 Tax=Geoalkalibacter sp. TaxID=3041440 RepID=UPI00272DE3C6|nr:ATP-binding protein [Geoalkalibacter sp.]